QALLRWMPALHQLADGRIGWRPVHVEQRVAQGGQAIGGAELRRDQLQLRIRRQSFQRLAYYRGQPFRTQPFDGRVDRREQLVDAGRHVAAQALVVRVHHLQALRRMPYLAVAEQARARLQLLGLRTVEMEEAQQQGLPAGVADRHLQLRTVAKASLDRLDHALDLGPLAGAQVRDRGDPRPVLVAQRQVEPQILD